MEKRRLLLISPYFPPANVIGAKRAVNIVHGIQNSVGWEVVVLASKPFKSIDSNQALPLPRGLKVVYGFESFLRPFVKYLVKLIFTPDHSKEKVEKEKPKRESSTNSKPPKKKISYTPFDQYLWDVPGALKSGKKIIKEFKPDVIWVNADPWSGLLVGHFLSKRSGIPWVVDMRDPWTVFGKKMLQRPKLTRRIIHYYERRFFETSSRVVFNTKNALQAYKDIYPKEVSDKFTFIRNAFNKNLFDSKTKESDERFQIGYFGSFRSFVSSEKVLEAFAHFVESKKLSPDQVVLVVNGSVDDQFWINLQESNIESYVQVNSEVKVKDSLCLLKSWDALLVIVSPDYKWMIPAKLYDYLIAQKPIIAISNNHEVNQIIEETQSGISISFDNTQAIADAFSHYYFAGKSETLTNDDLIKPYGNAYQSNRFLEVLDQAARNSNDFDK
ncbi:MAG: glycosyltransferase [Cyclobacteriaceae bacterium]